MMVGPLKQASVNFDQSGRSKGSAEVVFSQRCAPLRPRPSQLRTDPCAPAVSAHALAALSRYNGATLDGQAMSLELVTPAGALKGAVLSSGVAVGAAPPKPRGGGPGAAPQRVVTFAGRAVAAARAAPAPARGVARGGGGRRVGVAGGGAGGRAAGGGRAPKAVASAADLDAELDAYHGAQAQAQGAAGMQE